MIVRNRVFPFVSGLLVACGANGSAARADCADLLSRLSAAMSTQQLSGVEDLDARIAKDGSCGEPDINLAHRSKATLQFDLVKLLIKKGSPPSEYEKLLLDASKFLWDAATELGNIRATQLKFVEATVAYERAIELIKDRSLTPDATAPNEKTIKDIFKSAAESRMLAANEEGRSGRATYVAAAKDHRDGTVGGTMSPSIRDIKQNVVPIPINFETASATFSAIGQQAANEFLLALQQQRPLEITLVGHTDERGEANYNMRLSDERVKAVAEFLKRNGITAKIVTIAKGKSEPFQPSDVSQYNQEQIWALNRRVEWKRQ